MLSIVIPLTQRQHCNLLLFRSASVAPQLLAYFSVGGPTPQLWPVAHSAPAGMSCVTVTYYRF